MAETRHISDADISFICRALAIAALRDPGFKFAAREVAERLGDEKQFDEFWVMLEDLHPPCER